MKNNMLVYVGVPALMFGLIGLGCGQGTSSSHASSIEEDSGQWIPQPAIPAPSADRAVQDVIDGVANGNIYVVWDALPKSYQDDVTEIVHGFAAKVDAELWNKGFETARKVTTMLESQKDVILAMPNLHESSKFDVEVASNHWDRVVAPIKTITNSPMADLHALRNIDIREFLGTTGARLISDMVALSEISTDGAASRIAAIGSVRATLVNQDGESAVVRLEAPGEQPSEESFVRVEGKWIPSEMARKWSEGIGEAMAKLAEMSADDMQAMKPHVLQVLASIDGVLDQMNQASTADEFKQATKMGMRQVFGGLMSLAQSAQAE